MGRPRALTADQEREIRGLAEEGLSLRVIAERVGTSKDTVSRTLRPARAQAQQQARQRAVKPAGPVVPAVDPTGARVVGRNYLGEDIVMNRAGEIVTVGSRAVAGFARPYERIATVPPWGRLLRPYRPVPVSDDGRLLCDHCTRWRSLEELTDMDNGCPIGITQRPGALVPMRGNGLPVVDVLTGRFL